MKKKKILIFGAGAIGRGFLAPLLFENGCTISFVDNNKKLINKLKKRNFYIAAETGVKDYNHKKIEISDVFHINEKIKIEKYDIVFCCVGPNESRVIASKFKKAKVVISCENDYFSPYYLRKLSKNKKVYFGIPDVITSNTAPKKLLKKDDLTTVTEKGTLVLEKGKYNLTSKINQLNKKKLDIHWRAKLFIHNAPHAILAYLGFIKKYKYIHEAMNDKKIRKIVIGAMNEITEGLVKARYVPKNFAEKYKIKEISRFQNKLLFDPISRVAREPIRKLGKENRIVLSLRLTQRNKYPPKNVAIGVKAALNYYDKSDKESVNLQNLRKKHTDSFVLEKICGIEQTDPLNDFCLKYKINI